MKWPLVTETLKHALWGALMGTVLAIGFSPVFAQEEDLLVLREVDGPYDLAVAITPTVPLFGVVHLSVTVLDASTAEPVTDAQVKIVTHRPGDGQPGWALAFNSPTSPETYRADVNLERSGLWHLAIQVRSDLGEGTLEMSLEVPKAQKIWIGTLIWAVVAAAIAWAFVLIWRSARRTSQRRRGSPWF